MGLSEEEAEKKHGKDGLEVRWMWWTCCYNTAVSSEIPTVNISRMSLFQFLPVCENVLECRRNIQEKCILTFLIAYQESPH